MLVLFDIDGTLVLTSRAGLKAMAEAGRRLFGPGFSFDGVDFAGRLDPAIWADVAASNAIENPDALHQEFRATYASILEERFLADPTAYLLPGVESLLGRLDEHHAVTLGLVTGNYPETGRLKIQTAGLDPALFPVAAWGCDGKSRRDLPPLAMRLYEEQMGRPIEPDRVVIIGDTPHDIDCAHANGCRAIGVATGPAHNIDELREHKPDLALDDLSDTDAIMDWLMTFVETGSEQVT